MALEYGSAEDIKGMSLAIFQAMDAELSKQLLKDIEEAEGDTKEMLEQALVDARDNWRKLAYCIAKGVIDHIKSNMEIKKIKVIERVQITGDTGISEPSYHKHTVDIAAQENDLVFEELDYPHGQGHVE